MKHITTQDALRALEEAVAEKGEDYVYPWIEVDGYDEQVCAYVDNDGNPSCIAGNALLRLGVPVEVLRQFNTGYDVRSLSSAAKLEIPAAAVAVLVSAQMEQDSGYPWGYALETARGAVTSDA